MSYNSQRSRRSEHIPEFESPAGRCEWSQDHHGCDHGELFHWQGGRRCHDSIHRGEEIVISEAYINTYIYTVYTLILNIFSHLIHYR